jgi:hypothetical protein
MRRYAPSIVIIVAGALLAIIIYNGLNRSGVPQNISEFIVLSIGSGVTLFPIIPILVKAYYNSREDAVGLGWATLQGPLIRHPGISERNASFRYSFHLTMEQLSDIYNFLHERISGNNNRNRIRTIIQIYFRRNRVVRYDLAQIFSFENIDNEEIQRVTIEMFNISSPQTAPLSQISLEFMKEGYASIRYYILGNVPFRNVPDEVAEISQKLDRIIRNRLKKFPTFLVGLFLCGSLTWILLEFYLLYLLEPFSILIPVVYAILIVVILLLISAGATACLIFFPMHNFYWKDYTNFLDMKHSRGKIIINNVFGIAIGIFIGIISGILANYYSAKIGIGQP